MAEKKVSTTVRLTQRQDAAVSQEAKRLDISTGELMRRIFDEWMARLPNGGLAGKVYSKP